MAYRDIPSPRSHFRELLPWIYAPGIWRDGSRMNLDGSSVQALQMVFYNARLRKIFKRRAELEAATKSARCCWSKS